MNAVYLDRRGLYHRPNGEHPETRCGLGHISHPMMQDYTAESKGGAPCPICYQEKPRAVVALRPM